MAVEYNDNSSNYVCTNNLAAATDGWTTKGCNSHTASPATCTSHNRYITTDALGQSSLTAPSVGSAITANYINTILDGYKAEFIRSARTDANANLITNISAGNSITAATINNALSHLNDLYSGATLRVVANNPITAGNINTMITYLNSARAECVCNCNYSCTCNCNYGCTCYCNYSDKRLKTNIKFIGEIKDLKLYSYSYKNNLSKRHVGVIAQDLISTKYESALIKNSNGMYMVNYSKLPIKIIKGYE